MLHAGSGRIRGVPAECGAGVGLPGRQSGGTPRGQYPVIGLMATRVPERLGHQDRGTNLRVVGSHILMGLTLDSLGITHGQSVSDHGELNGR